MFALKSARHATNVALHYARICESGQNRRLAAADGGACRTPGARRLERRPAVIGALPGVKLKPRVLMVGQAYYNAWYLSRALRELGWKADVLNWDATPERGLLPRRGLPLPWNRTDDVPQALRF